MVKCTFLRVSDLKGRRGGLPNPCASKTSEVEKTAEVGQGPKTQTNAKNILILHNVFCETPLCTGVNLAGILKYCAT
jgi:hypothetical protein